MLVEGEICCLQIFQMLMVLLMFSYSFLFSNLVKDSMFEHILLIKTFSFRLIFSYFKFSF